MNRFALLTTSLTIASGLLAPGRTSAKTPEGPDRPAIQIAILLDTSNSMDGLIGQAKSQLWNVVNEFVKARKAGGAPTLEVALFEYGNNGLSGETGFVRLVVPLTDDLDRISEELFALRTNGGSEFCGKVIHDAVGMLSWSRSREAYRAIVIAGNEPFSQGPFDYHSACREAIGRGVLVNTIFCGPHDVGEATGWQDGASLAEGRYLSIDHDRRVVSTPTPVDGEIARLGSELNTTYIPYGRMGVAGQSRQLAQDTNAVQTDRGAAVARSISKGGAFYCNSTWDLVDALKSGTCRLEELGEADLPADFRRLSPAERKARLVELTRRRERIQERIAALGRERAAYLAREQALREKAGVETLDTAIVKAIRGQAARLGFTFEQAMDRKRILVIEDDPAIRRGLVDALGFAGYATLEANEGNAGAAAALEASCDLLLLDLVLPGRDGLAILREVREARSILPVIVLTARGGEADRVRGLSLGADDYVVKPFSVKELLARIEAVLRRSPERPASVRRVAFEGGEADLDRREVRFDDGGRSELSEREHQLLHYLACHAGRAISRDEILSRVWGLNPSGITTRTIDMHVARLREKLRDDPNAPKVLRTVRGRGYMLEARRASS